MNATRRGILACAIVLVCATSLILMSPAWGLNKIANWGFENAAEPGTSWTAGGTNSATQNSFTRSTTQAQEGTNSFYGQWTGANNNQVVNRILTQSYTTPSAAVQARLSASYWRTNAGGSDSQAFTVLLLNGATTVLTAVNDTTFRVTDTAWQSGTSAVAQLAANTTYTIEIRWVSTLDSGESEGRYVDNVRLQISPSGLSATAPTGGTTVALTWTGSTNGANGPNLRGTNPYRVYRGTTSGGETALAFSSTPSYTDSTTTGNTTYYYQVTDLDVGIDGIAGNADDNESPVSAEVSILTRPGVPTGVSLTGVTASNITVSWTAPTGGSPNYDVERSLDNSVWTTVGTNVTSPWSDTTVACNTLYYYRVHGYNATGDGAPSPSASTTTSVCPASVTTVGNGLTAEPSAATVAPESVITDLDNFTLRTSAGTDTVNSVTVTLSPAGAFDNIQTVSITNDAGTTTYGSVTPGSNGVVIPLSLSTINVTTTETQYHVRITPKSHAAMAAPSTGQSYATTGTVTAIGHTTSNTITYADSASGTITVDNLSPGNATWGTVTPGDAQVALNWTNPADADFSQVVILRSTASIADVPTEGATYSQGSTIGSSTVRYVGALQTFTDTGLTNGQVYYYRIFSKDLRGNYSPTGAQTGPHTPTGPAETTTVGNGTNPSNASLCPGGTATMLDAFTLQTSAGTDTVTAVTVSLAAGTSAGVALVEITNDAGGTVYGSFANPADTQSVTLTPNITASTTLTQYKVRITPKSHATMPAPAGSTYSVTGTVTAITSTNSKTYSDTASATVTIDNASPANATWGTNTAGSGQVVLNWTNPGTDFSQVVIIRSTATIADVPTEGQTYAQGNTIGASTVRYVGNLQTFTDTGLTNGQAYYYKIFAKDSCGNYATGSQTGPHTPVAAVENRVTTGTPTASATSCTQVIVNAPFTNDANGNSTTTVKRGTAAAGPFSVTVCSGLTGASPRICTDNTVSPSTTYYYEVTLADADGVLGTNPRVTGSVATPACGAPNPTTPAAVTAVISSCRQITVTAPFTGDGDADGWIAVEYNTTNTWPGTTACAKVMGSSPRQCLVTGLSPSTTYYTRTTFTDADGLAGALISPQVTGPHALPACGADAVAPTITILAPARDAVVGGTEKVKVAVWDEAALAATNPVQWAIDGGSFLTTVSVSPRYGCGAGCSVYEFAWNTTALAPGDHSITVKAVDAANNDARVSWNVVVRNNAANKPSGGGNLLRRTHGSQLCLDCHAIRTHSSQETSTKYGNWSVDCLTCHTPHNTTNIYLIRTVLRTLNSGFKTIAFQQDDRVGGTNPSMSYLGLHPGAPTYDDGICESCHTKTTHYRNDTSGGDHTHNQGARCAGCHKHIEGFKGAGCNGCHKGPPTTGKHTTHDGSGILPSSYTDLTGNRTATQYGFGCAKCHSGTHVNDTHSGAIGDPYRVEVAFDSTADPKNAGAAYVQKYPDATDQGTDLTKYWSWTSSIAGTDGNCTNSYCHSNAAPVGGTNTYATVRWNQAAALNCLSCHDTGGAASTLSPAHRLHTNLTKYSYGCVRCHTATVSDNSTVSNKANHVNGAHTLSFDAAGVNNSGGSYVQAPGYTCSNSYCHSSGQDRSAPYTSGPSIAWNTIAAVDCSSCHGGNATAAVKMGPSNDHAAHMDQSGYLGTNIACGRCHNATVAPTNDRAVTTWASHVNGTADVSMVNVDLSATGTYGGASTKTCTNSYCHSDGTETLGYINTNLDWDGGFAKANDCKACHGTEAGGIAGAPWYTNNTGSFDTRNSHAAHVAAATDCIDCHAGTVTASGALITSGALHLDKLVQISGTAIGSYTDATETCGSVSCHGGASPQWGGTVTCRNCHMVSGGATDQEIDDYTYNNGTMAKIDGEDWYAYGHGATAAFTESGNIASNFDNGNPGTRNGCLYCHATGVTHGVAGNPYRLANAGAGSTVAEKNGVCTVCHGGAGYNPGSGLIDAPDNIDAWHYGAAHSSTGDGGQFCWDCHDPHGDYNYASTQRLAFMIEKTPTRDHSGSTGWGIPTALAPTPDFRNNRDGTAGFAWGDYVSNALVSGTYRGMCQTCHTSASVSYFQQTLYTAGHNNTARCTTSCHTHDQPSADAFKPQGGGDCRGCHGAFTRGTTPARRAVDADFSKQSHHVGSGSTTTMGGALTNYDCIVCHAEGYVDATAANAPNTNSNYHGNGVIDLRNVDSLAMTASGTGSVFTFDKDLIGATPNPATWNSANPTWATQMQNSMDPFCLACHDSNGASTAHVSTWDGTGTGSATNPFADGTITNNYDQMSRGGVVDIKSRVTAGATSLDKAGEARFDLAPAGDSIADPPQGIYSRHAIRGQSLSVYSGTNATLDTATYWRVPWASNSVMACADCHTNDGANTTSGNAHGSNSEYLLKDASGNATEGNSASTYVCAQCHNSTVYISGTHTGNTGDFTDYTSLVGVVARSPVGNDGGNLYGMACTNCHGGGYETKGDTTAQFGTIHGTSQVMAVGQEGGTGTRQAYRFTNGNSMRFYDPAGWDGGATTCYTLSAGDSFGGCTKHAKGGGYTPPAGARGLKY